MLTSADAESGMTLVEAQRIEAEWLHEQGKDKHLGARPTRPVFPPPPVIDGDEPY